MTDDELVAGFEGLTLDAALFPHREHVRLAWVYLTRFPPVEALRRFADGLRRFAAHHGAAGRYRETITWGYLLLIHERMARGGAQPWEAFAAANADLFVWPGGALHARYRPETLASELARRVFLLPDATAPSSS